MFRIFQSGTFLFFILSLFSCASVIELSNEAITVRDGITQIEAEYHLNQFVRPSSTRGGLC